MLAQAVRPHDSQTADILSKIGAAIPRGIPIKTFSLFQQNPQTGLKDFSIEMLEQMIAENGGTLDGGRLPDAIRMPLNALGDQLERLPERFKDYLEISIPQAARFSLTLQAAGGVEFAVSTEGDPIRLLLPGFPMLIGVELRKLSFGAVAGGQLLLLAGSLRLDLFDVPTLAATLLLPFEQMQNVLPKAARLRRTAILDDFTMLIIPAGPVPIPVPLFFDKLGLEIVSVEGTEIVSSFSLPRPEFDAQEMLAILSNTLKYFRTPDFYFPLDQLPQHMNIVFTVGPNYLRLPKFLDAYDDAAWPQGAVTGGTVLGTQQALEPVNTLKLIWSLLNTIKRASPHDLIQAIPLKYRVGSKQAALFGFLNTRLDWALTTPEEFVSTAIPTLQLNRDEDVQEILAYLPADSSLGYATLPGWIDPCTDAAAAGQLGIHLRARPRVTAATRGVVALLRGKADLAGVIELDTLVALGAVSGDGMSAGLRFKGRLAGLLDIELAGAAWVAAGQEPRGFRVFGRASASMDPALLGRSEPVLEANWELNRQEIALGGRFNLLPEGCPLQLKGCLSGRLTGVSFELHGDLLFSLGSGFRFAARLALFSGTRQLDGRSENVDEFRLQLAFMAATLALEVIRRDNSLLMRGDFTPISLGGGLVRIEAGARPAGEPAALLQIEQGQLRRFSLHGAIALLGIANSSIDIDYQAEQQTLSFALQHQIDFAGLHHALSLQAHMSSPADIAAHAHFALVLDIGAALAAAVKALTGLPCPVFSLRTGFIIDSSIVLATERAIDPEELQRQEIVRRQQAAATRQQLAEHAQQLASVLEQALLRTAAARLRAEARLNTCHDAVDALRQEIVSTEKQLLGLRQVLEQRAPATAVERAAQVAAYAAAARRLGVEVEAHYALLQNEADALLHDRTLIRMAIETAELDWDRCEAGGDRVQARQLRDTVGKLRREEQLITRAVIQIRDLLTRRPEAELRNAYMQAQQEEQQARADRSATGQPLSASAEQRWAVEAELLRLREATQWQLPLAADDTVHPLPAPPATGKTSFSLKVQASVWLFGIRFQLDLLFEQADLQALAGRDVMASIPQLVQSAILSNAASMIRRGFSSLAAAAGALLRFLMDPAYRRTMLESGRSAAQHFLPAEQAHTLPPATISSPVTAALPTLAASPLAVGTAGELSDDEWASIQQQAHSALDQLSAGLAADSAIDAEHIREMLLTTGWAADDIQQMLDAAASV
ncbi:hypothetical protein ACFQT4_04455 [Pseudoduganella danionis]|uniref:hypothetical protein n=1 Tax=Pseudoduganella danionis TaxID=1890295 RepID=UPI0036209208